MNHRVFLAGASGAIGRRLTPLLCDAGYSVWGTTRSEAKTEALRALGAEPIVVNVYDAAALGRAMATARPDVVIHQLTDLPKDLDPRQMTDALARNARVREQGTRNLVTAAIATGAQRLIAQSLAWLYAPGHEPHEESDPLDVRATGERGITMRGVVALEDLTLKSPPLQGVVLRYGRLYGPGTHAATASDFMPIHVDAAAQAALLAIDHAGPGIFNIVEPNPHVATDKARRELGWDADFRLAA
ncbi:MAG TPA: NAD(P)-dependent oxidoreductase [Steroidobacteraceae bacterium]|nr:NAD(P)-dependent oxidoreductase [Steroidobacteraceae bacterium]